MQTSLQQKQNYLRIHVKKEDYEDFYEFCEKDLGTVDVNSWTFHEVVQNIKTFYAKKEKQNSKDAQQMHEKSYYDYQSGNQQSSGSINSLTNIAQLSQCATSRIQKQSSAIDLLSEILQSENQKRNTHNYKERNKSSSSASSISFDQFDFWTSSLTNSQMINSSVEHFAEKQKRSNQKYQEPYQNRQKSVTECQTKISYAPKTSETSYRNTMNQESNSNSEFGMNYFQHSVQRQTKKKTSPYIKKDGPSQPVQAKKQYKMTVKQVKNNDALETTVIKNEKGQKWLVEQKIFEQTIPCYKSSLRTALADPSLNIFIDRYDIIHRSFLASDYAMYYLKISPLGIEVKRNYQDFQKLKKNLQNFFPGLHLPYLEENSWFGSTDGDNLNSQKKMLQFFLRNLILNKQIRNSRIFQEFITIPEHKTMKRKFEKYQKIQKLKGVEQLCVLEGKVHLVISNQQKNYNDNMKRFIDKMNDSFEKLRRLTENITNYHLELMNTYKSLTSLLQNMQKQVKNFNLKVTTNQIKNLGSVFRMVRQCFKQDGSNEKFEYDLYSKKILPFLKFEHQNFKELNKLIETNYKFQRLFDKRSKMQNVNINQAYNCEEVRDQKKGICQESKSYIITKYQTGYYGRQLRMESQRVFDEMGVKFVKRWILLGQNYLDKFLKNIDFWKSVAKLQPQKFKTSLTF